MSKYIQNISTTSNLTAPMQYASYAVPVATDWSDMPALNLTALQEPIRPAAKDSVKHTAEKFISAASVGWLDFVMNQLGLHASVQTKYFANYNKTLNETAGKITNILELAENVLSPTTVMPNALLGGASDGLAFVNNQVELLFGKAALDQVGPMLEEVLIQEMKFYPEIFSNFSTNAFSGEVRQKEAGYENVTNTTAAIQVFFKQAAADLANSYVFSTSEVTADLASYANNQVEQFLQGQNALDLNDAADANLFLF